MLRGGVLSKARQRELRNPAIRHLFAYFSPTGSAHGAVKARLRLTGAPQSPLRRRAFCFRRRRWRAAPEGKATTESLPQEGWKPLIPDAHPGYITWEAFEANQVGVLIEEPVDLGDHLGGVRRQGLLTLGEMAETLGVRPSTVKAWHSYGLVVGHALNDKSERLYGAPGPNPAHQKDGEQALGAVARSSS